MPKASRDRSSGTLGSKISLFTPRSIGMKYLLLVFAFLSLIHSSSGNDVAVADAFIVSLPDTAKKQTRSAQSARIPDTILDKFSDASFQLSIYRWPQAKADVPLKKIPEQWTQNKEWASVSAISEGRTDSGIPFVTFKTRIVRDERQPFDSIMTVLRSPTGAAYMFQMTGDMKAIDAIRKSIKNK